MTGLTDPDVMARRLMQRAHNSDGLPEIAVGLFCLFVSSMSALQVTLPLGSAGYKAAVLAGSLLTLSSCGMPWALRWVRRRYLIEREGYMQPKPIDRKQIGLGILLYVLVAAVLFGMIPGLAQPDRWVLAGTGLLGGALIAWGGRLPRFVIEGVLVAAAGLAVAFAGVSLEAGFAMLFGFAGVVTLVSGSVVFRRFLRK